MPFNNIIIVIENDSNSNVVIWNGKHQNIKINLIIRGKQYHHTIIIRLFHDKGGERGWRGRNKYKWNEIY